MDRRDTFFRLREEHPVFRYESYEIRPAADTITLSYRFSIPGLCVFTPCTTIHTAGLPALNNPQSPTAQALAFSLGMVEAVSYLKCTCSPRMEVLCGHLDEDDIAWWKKLYFNGLGEMLYRNGIETSPEDLVKIVPSGTPIVRDDGFTAFGGNLIPVGGGKDSAVSLELLKEHRDDNVCFFINPKGAGLGCAERAGYGANQRLVTQRTIDPKLLELNAQGYLNGHTPFSAIVAFLCAYCAYLTGRRNIVLSNESSANEGNIAGTQINHQYSKSFAFERDFNLYLAKNITNQLHYFSLLRPFNELQIAKRFSAAPQYLAVFKSCNLGSKNNVWCCNCPKCLFVYVILSPFLTPDAVSEIFGENLLDRADLADTFDGLVGFTDVKPFECIGTREEVNTACKLAIRRWRAAGLALPVLLARYASRMDCALSFSEKLLFQEFNSENNVPPEFAGCVKEMFDFVSNGDC